MHLRNTLSPRCPLLVPTLILALVLAPAMAVSAEEQARFISAIDGDSLLVELDGRSRQVRLIGIDAPEHGQEYAAQAKREVMRRCYGKTLSLEFDTRRTDRYGRLLCYVHCDGTLLNEELVRAGFALAVRFPPDTRRAEQLEAAEREARDARRGFWLHGGLKQTPRQWRKAHPR